VLESRLEDSLNAPRDERDFKAELEIKTPAWLPGVRIAASFQRLWEKRGQEYANKTASLAGVDIDVLETQLSEGGQFADLFLEGGRRVAENGDEVLRDTVTRLVAAALRDNARIHDASYLMKKLSTCDALHVRVICAIPENSLDILALTPSNNPNRVLTQDYVLSTIRWLEEAAAFSDESIASRCLASNSLVRAALGELGAVGFTEKDESLERGVESALQYLRIPIQSKGAIKIADLELRVRSALEEYPMPIDFFIQLARMAASARLHRLTELGTALRGLIQEIDSDN
jgi:hypothetical protein